MIFRRIVITCIVLAASAETAAADAIDGSWCREGGAQLSIDGPNIVTPEGHSIIGVYNRHFFSYIVPPGEQQSGVTIQLRLLNEQTMQLRAVPEGAIQTWQRCSPPTT